MKISRPNWKICYKKKVYNYNTIKSKAYLSKILYIIIFYGRNIIDTACWIRKYIDIKGYTIKLFSLESLKGYQISV